MSAFGRCTALALGLSVTVMALAGSVGAEYDFIVNGAFDSNVVGWTESGSNVTWIASADKDGDPQSGGAELRTPVEATIAAGMYQCVPATEGISYTAAADARVPLANQSPGTYIYIFRVYYSSPGCSNTLTFHTSPATSVAIDGWQSLASTHAAPDNTESMWIYMVLYKNTPGVEAYGYVDNVTLTAPNDTDADGCSDGEELSPDPRFGGDRDPRQFWDFFDVDGTRAIDVADIVAILGHFGQGDQHPEYDPIYDRFTPDSDKLWRTAAATGAHVGIDVADVVANVQSFGHNCAN